MESTVATVEEKVDGHHCRIHSRNTDLEGCSSVHSLRGRGRTCLHMSCDLHVEGSRVWNYSVVQPKLQIIRTLMTFCHADGEQSFS